VVIRRILHTNENQFAAGAALEALSSLLQARKGAILDERRTQRILVERDGALRRSAIACMTTHA
jgi:hypothetical protein